jgi:hypothetical protein
MEGSSCGCSPLLVLGLSGVVGGRWCFEGGPPTGRNALPKGSTVLPTIEQSEASDIGIQGGWDLVIHPPVSM